jgi:hypothetical protein
MTKDQVDSVSRSGDKGGDGALALTGVTPKPFPPNQQD